MNAMPVSGEATIAGTANLGSGVDSVMANTTIAFVKREIDIGIEQPSSTGLRKLEVFLVTLICEPIMSAPITNSMVVVDHFKGLDVADTTIKKVQPFKPDLLIGLDYYWSFISGETICTTQNGLIAMKSTLGWVILGPMPMLEHQEKEEASSNLVTHVPKVSVSTEENDRQLGK